MSFQWYTIWRRVFFKGLLSILPIKASGSSPKTFYSVCTGTKGQQAVLFHNQISLNAGRKAYDSLLGSHYATCTVEVRWVCQSSLTLKCLMHNTPDECGSQEKESYWGRWTKQRSKFILFSVSGPSHISVHFQVHWTKRVNPTSGSWLVWRPSGADSKEQPTSERSVTHWQTRHRSARAPGWQVQPSKTHFKSIKLWCELWG